MCAAYDASETIYALSSGSGKAGVAVIRISGGKAPELLLTLTSAKPIPRVAQLTRIMHPQTQDTVDRGIAIWFPAPRSFTGEDCLELQVHGSIAVVADICKMLSKIPGVRLADPGEFSRRALENGKIDLIDAEALADLIDAETSAQRKLAQCSLEGQLRTFADRSRALIIELLADIEVGLDFSDEVDPSFLGLERIEATLREIENNLLEAESNYGIVERIRDGLTVVIAGPPNAGKSSLLNVLARRDAAIVSEYAGTTRDLIEVRLDLGGLPVNVIDTAGVRFTCDPVESEGVRRTLAKAEAADLILWLSPLGETELGCPGDLAGGNVWQVRTKADLCRSKAEPVNSDQPVLVISARTGYQMDVLIEALKNFAKLNMSLEGSVVIANERQRQSIVAARVAISAARVPNLPLEVVAEELRRAAFSLECLLGKIGIEDVLDDLFARFCVGK